MTTTVERPDTDKVIRRVAKALYGASTLKHHEFAALLGIRPSTLTTRLNGERAFTAAEVHRMAEIFGQDVRVFYEGKPDLLNGSAQLLAQRVCIPEQRNSALVTSAA